LVPIYKGKGSAAAPANYRGIAVINSLAKCFSAILEQRLSTCLESEHLRAPCQAGFRKRMGPTHNLFTLHHLQARFCRPDQSPLYVCFVDFVKAFDMVRRDLLWFRLEALGLKGQFLDALCAMYADVSFRVHARGKLGDLFDSLSGVKQGDPLSPTLFGIFIEALPEFLEAMQAAEPRLAAAGTPKLTRAFALFYMLFADDLTLISHTPKHMQAMLDALSEFCVATGMDVNIDKTECILMGSRRDQVHAPHQFQVPWCHHPQRHIC
jgi:hypothetical protein